MNIISCYPTLICDPKKDAKLKDLHEKLKKEGFIGLQVSYVGISLQLEWFMLEKAPLKTKDIDKVIRQICYEEIEKIQTAGTIVKTDMLFKEASLNAPSILDKIQTYPLLKNINERMKICYDVVNHLNIFDWTNNLLKHLKILSTTSQLKNKTFWHHLKKLRSTNNYEIKDFISLIEGTLGDTSEDIESMIPFIKFWSQTPEKILDFEEKNRPKAFIKQDLLLLEQHLFTASIEVARNNAMNSPLIESSNLFIPNMEVARNNAMNGPLMESPRLLISDYSDSSSTSTSPSTSPRKITTLTHRKTSKSSPQNLPPISSRKNSPPISPRSISLTSTPKKISPRHDHSNSRALNRRGITPRLSNSDPLLQGQKFSTSCNNEPT